MKKKVIIVIIIILVLILLIPIPLRLKDGGSVEYRALTYAITKYHQLDINSDSGYKEGIEIELFGMKIYNNVENSTRQGSEVIPKGKTVITMEKISNIDLLDDFLDNVDKYNKEAKSSKVEIVTYTIEGDEIVTTIEYNEETNEFLITRDNTKDEYASKEDRKVTLNKYSRFDYNLVKEIRDEDIYLILKPNDESNKDVGICVYNKKLEKNKDENRIKVKDANLKYKAREVSIEELVSYNGVLYARANVMIDYAGNPNESIGTINKLIGEEYLPALNGETNSEKLLNAQIAEANAKIMVLYINRVATLYQAIEF